MSRHIAIILSILMLSSCVATHKYEPDATMQKDNSESLKEKYNTTLNTWLNAEEDELLQQWGQPDDVYYISKKKKLLTFKKPEPDDALCKTTFTIEDGRVIYWRYEGIGCGLHLLIDDALAYL
tara:strand:+ start:1443 stop:1811 length:369 start_codon:yes stop_codon:yes gene_type:complete